MTVTSYSICGLITQLPFDIYLHRSLSPNDAYKGHYFGLLGAFAKLREATISFVVSVRPHGKHGFHWTDFHEIGYLSIFRKSVEKFQVSLKSDENNGYFT